MRMHFVRRPHALPVLFGQRRVVGIRLGGSREPCIFLGGCPVGISESFLRGFGARPFNLGKLSGVKGSGTRARSVSHLAASLSVS
jgi:hypothetical protein